MEKTMFTAKEAVTEYFQGTISYWKLLQDFHAGRIPGVKLSAKRIIFRKEALDKWMQDMENQSIAKDNSYTKDTNNNKINTVFKRVNVF